MSNVSAHGLWLLWRDTEYFLGYKDFPWFKEARISEIMNVRAESGTHLYWPDLDIDLNLDIIDEPNRYPLISKG